MVAWRTPAEVLLGRAPQTRLSLVHPFLSQKLSAKAEVKIGSTPLNNFEEGQEVLIHDHRPDTKSKWRKAKILTCLGPLSYQVTVDHQTRTAHVDHLLPVGSLPSHKKTDESPEDKQSEEEKPDHYPLQWKQFPQGVSQPGVPTPDADSFRSCKTLNLNCLNIIVVS